MAQVERERGRTSFIMTKRKIISLLENEIVEACMESLVCVSGWRRRQSTTAVVVDGKNMLKNKLQVGEREFESIKSEKQNIVGCLSLLRRGVKGHMIIHSMLINIVMISQCVLIKKHYLICQCE